MESIKRTNKENLGGSILLCFVPISSVDKDAFPVRTPGSISLTSPITLVNGTKWLKLEATRETINSNSDSGNSESLYNHSIGGFFAGDMNSAAIQFDKMVHSRFLVLRKDANGFWILKGTLKEPLKFSYKKVTKDKASGTKGYEFEFTGFCTKPEIYFEAAFEIDDSIVIDASKNATAILKNTAGTALETKTIAAGTTQELIAPNAVAVIKNSAGTTIRTEPVPSGVNKDIVLNDVNHTDSDGSTVSRPNGVGFVATPQIKVLTWQLNYNGTDDVIYVTGVTGENLGTLTAGTGSNVGTITVSTDGGVTYGALSFPFTPVNGTTYYFRRGTAAVNGTYKMTGTYV